MPAEPLVMIDENKEDETIAVLLAKECKIVGNVLMIPKNQALKMAASVILQMDILNGHDS